MENNVTSSRTLAAIFEHKIGYSANLSGVIELASEIRGNFKTQELHNHRVKLYEMRGMT